jgi:hypothetical protein
MKLTIELNDWKRKKERKIMDPKRFKCVYTTSGMPSAEMLRMLLESYDISVIIVPESAGVAYGLTIGPLGSVDILVEEENVERANEILRQYEQGELSSKEEDSPDNNTEDFTL